MKVISSQNIHIKLFTLNTTDQIHCYKLKVKHRSSQTQDVPRHSVFKFCPSPDIYSKGTNAIVQLLRLEKNATITYLALIYFYSALLDTLI